MLTTKVSYDGFPQGLWRLDESWAFHPWRRAIVLRTSLNGLGEETKGRLDSHHQFKTDGKLSLSLSSLAKINATLENTGLQ